MNRAIIVLSETYSAGKSMSLLKFESTAEPRRHDVLHSKFAAIEVSVRFSVRYCVQ